MAPLVSVIIPIYNAAATLKRAVDSVLSQSVRDMELLLIDDGSLDETPDICKALAARDARVQVFRQENLGISAARNRGLRHACGQWIAFCDDDDEYLPGALQQMLQAVKHSGIDVVRGDFTLLRANAAGDYTELPHTAGVPCTMTRRGDYGAFLAGCGPQFVWNAIYRRTAIAGIFFEENCRFGLEDFIFNAAVYTKIDSAVYLNRAVYCHYEGAGSTSALQSTAALGGRIMALRPWLQAEYTAVASRCTGQNRAVVWAGRCAGAVTFLMHQLHDAKAPRTLRRQAWGTLRGVLKQYPTGFLDAVGLARYSKKAAIALIFFKLHIQGLYEILPHREGTP